MPQSLTTLTVAIPTYNGAERLPRVLKSLLHQRQLDHVQWDILVVDNNSTDATAQVVKRIQSTWKNHPQGRTIPLRYLKELRQGAAYARQRAVVTAQGDWIAFLDDDNIPAPNWLAQALEFIETAPGGGKSLGAISGQIHGVFPEGNDPDVLKYVRPYLAIVERGDRPFPYDLAYRVLPPTAGLVVRREAWLQSVPQQLLLGGRTDECMLTSEDLETLVYFQRQGWEIWYNPAMEIDHLIPQWRLERNYLLAFLKGIGLTRSTIRMLRLAPWQRPVGTLLYGLNDARRLLSHLIRSRHRLGQDLLTDCQTMMLKSTLISPVFMAIWQWRQRKKHRLSKPSDTPSGNSLSQSTVRSPSPIPVMESHSDGV